MHGRLIRISWLRLAGMALMVACLILLVGLLFTNASLAASQKAPQRIVGPGLKTAALDQYPWVARLETSVDDRGNSVDPSHPGVVWSGFCSGSLIDSQWVLSAAHCAQADDFGGSQKRWQVRFLGSASGQTIRVDRVVVHPAYSGWLPNYWSAQDFSLLHLARPASGIDPVDYAWDNRSDQAGRSQASIAGYGLTSNDGDRMSESLNYAQVKLSSDPACANQPELSDGISTLRINSAFQLCRTPTQTQSAASAISCNGDSGGPVWSLRSGKPLLIGVVSWGASDNGKCWAAGAYDVYSRVGAAYSWISRAMGQDKHRLGISLSRSVSSLRMVAAQILSSSRIRVRLALSGQGRGGRVLVWPARQKAGSGRMFFSNPDLNPAVLRSGSSRGSLFDLGVANGAWQKGQCVILLSQTINGLGNYGQRSVSGFRVGVGRGRGRLRLSPAKCSGQSSLLQ